MIYAYRVEYEMLERHIKLTDDVMDEVNLRRESAGLEPL
jgi:hypothetical protein